MPVVELVPQPGQKAERLSGNEAQLSLAVLGTLLGGQQPESAPNEKQKVEPHERSKPTGRKPLPEHLPRIDVEIVPDEVMREGLDLRPTQEDYYCDVGMSMDTTTDEFGCDYPADRKLSQR